MPVYPNARWEPISGGTDGPMTQYQGAVLHVNQSNGADLFNWENNGANGMSSHFQVAKDGTVFQYIDTRNDSWCQMDGNRSYISIETEGYPTESLTPAQVSAIALLYRWLHNTHGIPYVLAEVPGQPGFGWHGMGGAAWGGHFDCPGDLRKAQRAQILALANPPAPTTTPTEEDEVGAPVTVTHTTHPGHADRYFVTGPAGQFELHDSSVGSASDQATAIAQTLGLTIVTCDEVFVARSQSSINLALKGA